jgi:hypothetical protein
MIDNVFVFDEYLLDARLQEIRLGGSAAITGVPEPATFGLIGVSQAGVFVLRRRQQSAPPTIGIDEDCRLQGLARRRRQVQLDTDQGPDR